MSKKAEFKDLLDAGVHFGHLKRKWNPAMAPYIFDEQKGIHIIDLNKTMAHLDQACAAMKQIAKSGKKILFVATKKQAKQIVEEYVKPTNMPFITERWAGGMLTNFATTRKTVRKMAGIDKMRTDGTWETLSKRERLFIDRQRAKMEKNFGSIADMTRTPSAIFIVDILKEKIAVKEAKKLGVTTFAMVDTNCNPKEVDFPIPSNDDASKSIAIILSQVTEAIKEGLEERKNAKAQNESNKKAEIKKRKEANDVEIKEVEETEKINKAEPIKVDVEKESKEEVEVEVKEEATTDKKEATTDKKEETVTKSDETPKED